ncbi:MAG: tRNA preQ1(34) S-adenosylmethionine ribosyltransferase-isomerase QueA [Christensenellaceae bacterium]|nr:tRNA preQ1(34) S-adenosylmethionine ribosyltransferase-isomerase QueA [Christensenellaceae bacterium]
MNTKDFYYDLPEELIAQNPAEPRDSSRLMVYHRESGQVEHRIFRDIKEYLRPGDALVVNETKVIPARLFGVKEGTTRQVEFLLLVREDAATWQIIMRPGRKLRIGDKVVFGDKLSAEILEKLDDGVARIRFIFDGVFEEILDEYGNMPLPPYITEKLKDKTRYQTVYAKEEGSAAAPTAGLHFTPELMQEIREMGVEIIPVLLHVGLGTFRPVKVDDVENHKMHSEYYCVTQDSADRINAVRKKGGRIIAVGTTSVRTLESVAAEDGTMKAASGQTSIFIYPGYRFKCVDALITNFHLPESTLIMLVSALAGHKETLDLYAKAVEERYRVFSFGDAMFIE